MFTSRSHVCLEEWTNNPPPKLLPVTLDELEQAVSHALRFDGRKHFKLAGEIMGKVTASHLVHCLTQAGYVVMKKPPTALAQGCPYAASARRVMDAAAPTGRDSQGEV